MHSATRPMRGSTTSCFFNRMLAVVDIGNTNIVLAIHDGNDWRHIWRVYSDQRKTGDEYYVIFRSLIEGEGVDVTSVDSVIISSVVPNLTRSMQKDMQRIFNREALVVTHDIHTGLVRESIPQELGSDLLCNLAWAHHTRPDDTVMTVDFGTALTFSTVDGEGRVKGVAIVPGLLTSVNALFGSTAQLPQVELKIPTTVMGRNSEDSIRAGIMYGYAGLVESIIHRTEDELGHRLYVMATGGLSMTISPLISRIDHLDKRHTLDGLRLIASLNLQSR